MPGKVLDLTSDASLQNILSLSWTAPIGCSSDDYQVEYELTRIDQCRTQDPDRVLLGHVVLESVVISELMPYSTYSVHITARNGGGYGATESISDVTKETSKYHAHQA